MTAVVGPSIANMDALDAIRTCCSARPRPDPFSAVHGLIGVMRGNNIITSPNTTWIPEVQLQRSSVGLCEDMRFGRDDYCLAPQWYHDEYAHLAAIPRRPMEGDASPFSPMWYTPTREADFTLADSRAAHREPGYIQLRLHNELSALKTQLCEEATCILLDGPGDRSLAPSPMSAAITCLKHAWIILTSSAAGFDEKRLEFAEFQRSWLELKGMVDFRAWKDACAYNPSLPPPAEARRCVGCFVESVAVAMLYYDMGVPVWLVRDKMSVLQGDIYIERATTLTMAPEFFNPPVCVDRDASFPFIYLSSPRDKYHYIEQHRFSRMRSAIYHRSGGERGKQQEMLQSIPPDQMGRSGAMTCLVELQTMRAQTAGPPRDGNVPSSSSSSSSTEPSSSSLARHRSQRQGPYKKFAGARNSAKMNEAAMSVYKAAPPTYHETTGPDEPRALVAWTSAYSKLDTRRLKTESTPPLQCSTFPLPSSFLDVTPERTLQYMQSWMHIRPHWLGQMRAVKGRVLALRSRSWRDALHFGIGGPVGSHTVSGRNLASLQADFKDANLIVSDDGRVITFDNGEQLGAKVSRISGAPDVHIVEWRGHQLNLKCEPIPPWIKRQLLWELHELNFRFDLIRLDNAMSNAGDDLDSVYRRQDLLSNCWGAPQADFYDPVEIDFDWPGKDVGLASATLRERLPYLRHLYGLCSTWPDFVMPRDMDSITSQNIEREVVERLEKELCAALVQAFYDLFLRPMVAPRRLFDNESYASVLRLPTEMRMAVLYHLNMQDLGNVTGVSHSFRQLALPLLWRTIDDDDRWVKSMFKYMLCEIADNAEALKRDALRAQRFALIRDLRFSCRSALGFKDNAECLTLMRRLQKLAIRSDSESAFAWGSNVDTIQLQHLSKLSISGCDEFVIAWLKIVEPTGLLCLRLDICSLEFPRSLLDCIADHSALQELYVKLGGWGDGWTIQDILAELDCLPNLTTLSLLGEAMDCGDDPEYLNDDDAVTIAEYWPNLRVLAVALADMDFFLSIVELPHLEELTLNAWFWESGFRDASDATCTNLRLLHFSGSPPHWAAEEPTEIKMVRFPNLKSLEMVPGHGGALRRF